MWCVARMRALRRLPPPMCLHMCAECAELKCVLSSRLPEPYRGMTSLIQMLVDLRVFCLAAMLSNSLCCV